MNAVIGVRHHQLEVGAGGTMEEVEEDDGVEPAGDCDERAAAGQRERCEMRAELVVEVHRGKVNRLTRLRDD